MEYATLASGKCKRDGDEINSLCTKSDLSDLKIHFVPRSKHCLLRFLKTDKLMLYREIIAVCCEIQPKHINALWAEHRIFER